MLNPDNMREVSDNMLEKSRKYTEEFWQMIFDKVEFDKNFISQNTFNYYLGENNPDDPLEVFNGLVFTVTINCFGVIYVRFDTLSTLNRVALNLSTEYLLSNHFTQSMSNEFEYILKLDDI